MSYYSQSQYGNGSNSSRNSISNATPGLQFLPSQFDPSSGGNVASAYAAPSGTMNSVYNSGVSTGSYSYSADGQRERLSTGILAAFGTTGYPGEPPLLEGNV